MPAQTVNINCTFDAGYSFVGYTLDPLALKQASPLPSPRPAPAAPGHISATP